MALIVMSLERVCQIVGLTEEQCSLLAEHLKEICPSRKGGGGGRARSKWQQCIAERRKGQKFDPQAIRELAKEYRAGRCP